MLLNDNNRDCCRTLQLSHPTANVVCCSMCDLNLDQYRDKVDLLAGGVPCQSFSQAGSRKGLDDPRGELMLQFANMTQTLRPKIFMIENVKGLLTHNSGETILQVIQELNRDNLYHVEYQLLNACDYGVPQKRERVFIVGTLKTLGLHFTYPSKSGSFEHYERFSERFLNRTEVVTMRRKSSCSK